MEVHNSNELEYNTAVYHAGAEVLLTDGFVAGNGTTFRAYVEGCSGNFQSIQTTTEMEEDE